MKLIILLLCFTILCNCSLFSKKELNKSGSECYFIYCDKYLRAPASLENKLLDIVPILTTNLNERYNCYDELNAYRIIRCIAIVSNSVIKADDLSIVFIEPDIIAIDEKQVAVHYNELFQDAVSNYAMMTIQEIKNEILNNGSKKFSEIDYWLSADDNFYVPYETAEKILNTNEDALVNWFMKAATNFQWNSELNKYTVGKVKVEYEDIYSTTNDHVIYNEEKGIVSFLPMKINKKTNDLIKIEK